MYNVYYITIYIIENKSDARTVCSMYFISFIISINNNNNNNFIRLY